MKDQLEDFIYRRVKNANKQDIEEILAIFSQQDYDKGAIFKERDTIINPSVYEIF
jgi:hypothetical protein